MRGRVQIKLLGNLPALKCYSAEDGMMLPSHISIPQPEGPDLPIISHDIHTASKMLGVHFSPAGNLMTQVGNMVQIGLDWVDCLRTKPVCRNNAWLSFYLQLFPALLWGLVTVCMPSKKLNTKIQRVYEMALPFLSVSSPRPGWLRWSHYCRGQVRSGRTTQVVSQSCDGPSWVNGPWSVPAVARQSSQRGSDELNY
jgi:hypothetical protein